MPQQQRGGVVLWDDSEGSLSSCWSFQGPEMPLCCLETWAWHKVSAGTPLSIHNKLFSFYSTIQSFFCLFFLFFAMFCFSGYPHSTPMLPPPPPSFFPLHPSWLVCANPVMRLQWLIQFWHSHQVPTCTDQGDINFHSSPSWKRTPAAYTHTRAHKHKPPPVFKYTFK